MNAHVPISQPQLPSSLGQSCPIPTWVPVPSPLLLREVGANAMHHVNISVSLLLALLICGSFPRRLNYCKEILILPPRPPCLLSAPTLSLEWPSGTLI